jgi:predicted ester cyclase
MLIEAAHGHVAAVADVCAKDVLTWTPSHTARGRLALMLELTRRKEAFSDVELSLEITEALGDKLVAEWHWAGTHTGPLLLTDEVTLSPTGRRVEVTGTLIAVFSGDEIVALYQHWDEVGFVQGLGLLP